MLDTVLEERLLNSIENNRLVVFCGAGLSMASPSNLPSAFQLAIQCADIYEELQGRVLPKDVREDLEKLAEHFASLDQLHSMFINRLVPKDKFSRNPNKGHEALADFLASHIVRCVISTNFDVLIEEAARRLGEPAPKGSIDGNEASTTYLHEQHLKIHGCIVRDEANTLWCRSQLDTKAVLKQRHQEFKLWLAANLREKDLIFLGFWSDWSYLNSIFEATLGGIEPASVVIVNPHADEASLRAKAPQLWAWSDQPTVRRILVSQSGDEFLDDLRASVCRWFLRRVHSTSRRTYELLTGRTVTTLPVLPDTLTTEDLYRLRLDVCGTPIGKVTRHRQPDATMETLGAVHIGLVEKGASVDGHCLTLGAERVRVVYAQGTTLSTVQSRYKDEPASPFPATITVCVGAKLDGGVPTSIVRGPAPVSTVVRPVSTTGLWLTDDEAAHLWKVV